MPLLRWESEPGNVGQVRESIQARNQVGAPPACDMSRPSVASVPDLVLGLAAGLHAGDTRPFLASLRAAGFAGECVLLVTATTRGLGETAALGCRTVRLTRPETLAHVPFNALRYLGYREFLAREGHRFRRVLLSDARDVIFQRDPFDFPWPNGLNVVLEHRGTSLGQCEHMRRWVTGHLGAARLAELADQPISCSGTTLGDVVAVRRYLEQMAAGLLPFAPGPGMAGYDQAVHNHLLYSGLLRAGRLDPVTEHDNSGPILTLGLAPEPVVDASGTILTERGVPAHVVHQYDRHPRLFAAVRRRFGQST